MDKQQNVFKILLLFSVLYIYTPSYFSFWGTKAHIIIIFSTLIFLLFFSKFYYPIICHSRLDSLINLTYIWATVLGIISLMYGSSYGVITWILPWVVIVPFLIKGVDSKTKLLKIIDTIIFVALIVAILGIFEELSSVNVFSYLNTDNYVYDTGARLGYVRIYSFTSHPITYGLFCMFILMLIFYRMTLPGTRKKKYYITTYILVFISAMCTFSRSSIIFIIISQLLLLWFCGYRKFIERMVEITLLIIIALLIISYAFSEIGRMIQETSILVLAVFSDTYTQKLKALGYQWDTSGVADRFDLWKIVFNRMKDHWLFGHGPGTTLTNVFLTNSAGNQYEKTSIEGQPLLVLFRYGIFAAILE